MSGPQLSKVLPSIAEIYAAALSGFQTAHARVRAPGIHRLKIANRAVVLEMIGRASADLFMAALRHHVCLSWDAAEFLAPALRVRIFDGADVVASVDQLESFQLQRLQHHVSYFLGDDCYKGLLTFGDSWSCFQCFHKPTNEALFWISDFKKLPVFEKVSPLMQIFHWWFNSIGFQLMHAAAIGLGDRGILLSGFGGCGKSTTAAICAASGFKFLGDDFIVCSTRPVPMAYSLYQSCRISIDWAERLGIQDYEKGGDKTLFFVDRFSPGSLVSSIALVAIVQPSIDNAAGIQLLEATNAEIFRPLAASTAVQLSAMKSTDLRYFSELVGQLPKYRLALGENVAQLRRILRALILNNNTIGNYSAQSMTLANQGCYLPTPKGSICGANRG